ncbi:ABC transporter ATP-binding protein [Devosia sp. CN2-171]|uniref:ABC transporter ATP-binding protein n=1 Tax=Devosia sp. CN2-171 TaxID=3400909 RepID=UPI003BF92343
MGPVLNVNEVSKRYGAKLVVDKVSLAVATGECLGIIGPNGAGKTTLFNLLDGSAQADSGVVSVDGQDISRWPQYRRARLGVGRAYQVPRPFTGLTVYENVLAGIVHGPMGTERPEQRALDVLERVGLADKRNTIAAGLRLLDRKRLELAKAVSVGSKVLLLDEVAGGLTEGEVLELVEMVKQLKREHAVLWIEHIAHALMAAADRLLVLHFGAKLIEGPPKDVMAAAIVKEVYLGISIDDPAVA